jgi:hypothetical protein
MVNSVAAWAAVAQRTKQAARTNRVNLALIIVNMMLPPLFEVYKMKNRHASAAPN